MRLSTLLNKALSYEFTHENVSHGKKKYKSYIEGLSVKCFGAELSDFLSVEILNVVNNSKLADEASIFVAVRGVRRNAEDFIGECNARGVKIFVAANGNIKLSHGLLIISDNPRKLMAELLKALFLPEKPRMKIVGITGTKGKSTVTAFCAQMLEALGYKSLSVGTLGITGIAHESSAFTNNTTPDAVTIYPLLAEGERLGYYAAVIEVSSQALKQMRVFGIPFDLVVFTSLGVDHIGDDEHPDFSDYISSKRTLFSSYGAECAVVNYDDAYSAFFSADCERVIRCGTTRGSDFLIEDVNFDFFGTSFTLNGVQGEIRLPGIYNAVNCALAVAAVSEITDESTRQILDAAKNVILKGRFECYKNNGRYFIIDYAHNEKSLIELIGTVRKLTKGRVIALFGSVGERSFDRRKGLARAAERFADFSIITEDNPGAENPYSITNSIYSAFIDKTCAKVIQSRYEAIKYAVAISNPADAVLLLGKGHEDFIIRNGVKLPFAEKDILDLAFKDFNENVENGKNA